MSRLQDFAKQQKSNPSLPEAILWRFLRVSPFKLQFENQKVLGQFIVDFYCEQLNLVIEVDGSFHEWTRRKDQKRDRWLINEFHAKVTRFWAKDVFNGNAVKTLRTFLPQRKDKLFNRRGARNSRPIPVSDETPF